MKTRQTQNSGKHSLSGQHDREKREIMHSENTRKTAEQDLTVETKEAKVTITHIKQELTQRETDRPRPRQKHANLAQGLKINKHGQKKQMIMGTESDNTGTTKHGNMT